MTAGLAAGLEWELIGKQISHGGFKSMGVPILKPPFKGNIFWHARENSNEFMWTNWNPLIHVRVNPITSNPESRLFWAYTSTDDSKHDTDIAMAVGISCYWVYQEVMVKANKSKHLSLDEGLEPTIFSAHITHHPETPWAFSSDVAQTCGRRRTMI